ncbi:hypothetical protein EV1_013999 [Malus domestica]
MEHGMKRGGYGVVWYNYSGEFLGAMTGGSEENFAIGSQVIFEGDSSPSLAKMKNMGDNTSNLGPLTNDIRSFLSDISQKSFSLIQREANSVAHRLARTGIGCHHVV